MTEGLRQAVAYYTKQVAIDGEHPMKFNQAAASRRRLVLESLEYRAKQNMMVPLTRDELGRMIGRPIYVINCKRSENNGWHIVEEVREKVVETHRCRLLFYRQNIDWVAYKREPGGN